MYLYIYSSPLFHNVANLKRLTSVRGILKTNTHQVNLTSPGEHR